MKVKSMHLEFFKGVTDKEYSFFDRTKISDENGGGKSTIADAHFWLWCNRNYELTDEPEIRPDNVEECQPRVTEILELNGKEITVCKYQKRVVSKPDADGKVKVSYQNKYEINSVSKSRRDFDAYFENEGINMKTFLTCSHPEVFTAQKDKDMRAVIMAMASAKSDLEIAQMSEDTMGLAELLKSYKLDEIEAMNKSTKANAKKRQNEIPSIIQGLEMAKVDIDCAEQELFVADCKRKIAELDARIGDSGKALSDLMNQNMQLNLDLSAIMQPMSHELSEKRRKIENEIFDTDSEYNRVKNAIATIERNIALEKEQLENAEKQRDALTAEWRETKKSVFTGTLNFDESAWVFDESSTRCSLCGQPLPADKVEELKASFEQKKADARAKAEKELNDAKSAFEKSKTEKIALIENKGREKKSFIEYLNKSSEKNNSELAAEKKRLAEIEAKQDELKSELAALPEEVDYTANADYVALKGKIDAIIAEIEKLKSAGDPTEDYKVQKAELEKRMDEAKEVIAQASINTANDEKIEALNREKTEKEQIISNAENILCQIDTLSKRKNELLVDEINSHFKIVKWKLFDYQKNGEYKDVCVPMINGKLFTHSMNTGLKVRAKLDICDSIQKFYGMDIPVFLDNAESINDKNIPVTDCQLIVLKVVEESTGLKVEEMR